MHQLIKNAIDNLPTNLKELERRAIFSTILQGEEAATPFKAPDPTKSNMGYGVVKYYGWNDGAGQSYSVWLSDHETALITFFEHECNFNFYGGHPQDAELQESFYQGIPQEFEWFVYDQEETYENLNIEISNGRTVYTASGVIWFTDGQWFVNEAYSVLSEEQSEDGGISYCLMPLTLGNYDTVDEYVDYLKEEARMTYEDDEEDEEDEDYVHMVQTLDQLLANYDKLDASFLPKANEINQ